MKFNADDVYKAFPAGYTARPGQMEVILEIVEAINQGYEYIVLEAGTGTGKSFIAATLANLLENKGKRTFIVTSSKQLQGQYERDFGYKKVIGRSNFNCLQIKAACDKGYCQSVPSSAHFTCEFGYHLNDGNLYVGDKMGMVCPYWRQKWAGMMSPVVLMNYPYFLAETNYSGMFTNRSLCVFDEAHNIEQQLMSFIGKKLNFGRVKSATGYTIVYRDSELEDVDFWIVELLNVVEAYVETIKEYNELIGLEEKYYGDDGVTEREEGRLRALEVKFKIRENENKKSKLMKLEKRIENFKSIIGNLTRLQEELECNSDNWAVCKNIKGKDNVIGVEFKPVFIKQYAPAFILHKSIVKLFMSATILDSKLFMEWLGVPDSEIYTIHVPTPFDKKKRPIISDYAGFMTFKKKKESMPVSIPILERILSKHREDKGIIHTNSYTFSKYIIGNIRSNRFETHNTSNREEVINRFKATEEPKVLISPSITEGVDLPYDECRFQVIYKIPYPFLGDNQIRKRNEQDGNWYTYKTVLSFVQAYGRGMRAVDDECVTYVVDKSLDRLLGSFFMPDFVLEAIKEE